VAVCGGAPLSAPVAKFFVGLGLPLVQGYGLTETSPVLAVNQLEDNDPASVGEPLQDVEVRIGPNEELLVKSPGVMMGYWHDEAATREVIDAQGWFHTGDKARVERNHIYITGRVKDIIVLANGEKVPPADMEAAIVMDNLFEQVMLIGEGKPFLSALVVLERDAWKSAASRLGVDPADVNVLHSAGVMQYVLDRIASQLREFPGYAQVRRVALFLEPWTVENGLATPTLKLKRNQIMDRLQADIANLYEGH
jgi:long-chain acyl-CoA synthetase